MSFGNQPNDKNIQLAVRMGALPPWSHPERIFWHQEWKAIRDAFQGEVEVKRHGPLYLPKLEDQNRKEYERYLERAVFFNMVRPTVTKLVGTLFRRPAKVSGIPSTLPVATITKEGMSLIQYGRLLAQEMVQMGRVGVLLDRSSDPDSQKPPFFATYIAENIMDWELTEIDGRYVLTRVVLREIRQDRQQDWATRIYFASYRKLVLEYDEAYGQYVYRQYLYTNSLANADLSDDPTEIIEPTNRGVPFDFIPFMFLGAISTQPDVEVSPIYDIVKLNFSHYKSYAQLEHGRFYTANPIYYVPTAEGEEKGDYTLGPGSVWQVAPNGRPGILEFHGQGLNSLEKALETKEQQIEAIGGKLIDGARHKTGQSDKQAQATAANEQSLLLACSLVLDTGLTQGMQWMAAWMDIDADAVAKIAYETNKSFTFDQSGAREFRAIQQMYMDGVIPVEVVYDYLLRAEVVPDWMDQATFTAFLKNAQHFPNQSDISARLAGFPDSITQFEALHPEQAAAVQAFIAQQQLLQKPDKVVNPKPAQPAANPASSKNV